MFFLLISPSSLIVAHKKGLKVVRFKVTCVCVFHINYIRFYIKLFYKSDSTCRLNVLKNNSIHTFLLSPAPFVYQLQSSININKSSRSENSTTTTKTKSKNKLTILIKHNYFVNITPSSLTSFTNHYKSY